MIPIATKTSEQSPSKAVVVTPPATRRTRTSSANPALVSSMAEQLDAGWVSDGQGYTSKREAANAAVVYRRALIRFLGGLPAKGNPVAATVASKVWEQDGHYVFALGRRK